MHAMDRQRAARAVTARYGELGLTQQELADMAAVDIKTIGNLVKRGRWPIARTRTRIEKALGWPPGEMERIASEEEQQAGPYPFVPSLLRKDITGNGELTPAEKDVVLAAIDAALRAEQEGGRPPGRAPRRARDAERRSAS